MRHLRRTIYIAGLALCVLGACPGIGTDPSGFDVDQQARSTRTCAEPAQGTTWRAETLKLLNQERAAHNVPPLVRNQALEDQANQYACELIDYAFFSHCNPSTGATLGQRASAAGYDYLLIGESIARGYATPAEVFEHWLTGSSDYENILEPRFVDIGIAVRTHGGYEVYCVAAFGQPQ